MIVTHKNYGDGRYVEIESNKLIRDYRIEMIRNNHISRLITPSFSRIDEKMRVKYRIDGLRSLGDALKNEVLNQEFLVGFLRCLSDLAAVLSQYLLKPDELVLTMNCIFQSPVDGDFYFIYAPGEELGFEKQLKSLLEEMMPIYDHSQNADVVFLYRIYSRLIVGSFTPRLLTKLMDSGGFEEGIDGGELNAPPKTGDIPQLQDKLMYTEQDTAGTDDNNNGSNRKKRLVRSAVIPGIIILIIIISLLSVFKLHAAKFCIVILLGYGVYIALILMDKGSLFDEMEDDPFLVDVYMDKPNDYDKKTLNDKHDRKNVNNTKDMNDAEDTNNVNNTNNMNAANDTNNTNYTNNTNASNDTMIFMAEKMDVASRKLLLISTYARYQPYEIKEGINKLGRSSKECDMCIRSEGISRVHALLERNGDSLLIKDEESTNGTFVDNRRVDNSEWRSIFSGNTIRLGEEEFFVFYG